MQLLNKLGSRSGSSSSTPTCTSTTLPTFNLYQCEPKEGGLDLAEVDRFFPALRKVGETDGGPEGIKMRVGPRVRFLRYKAGGAGLNGAAPIDWGEILLAKPDVKEKQGEIVTGTTIATGTGEKLGWWSSLWKSSSDVGETTLSPGQSRRVNSTRGAIMCLPKR
jgi:hypothetical protein